MIRGPLRLFSAAVVTLLMALSGCSTESTKGAAQGAAGGAAVGAVGGIVSALVFGGDVADAAARGAVWGGSTGAVSGGIQGARVADQNQANQARQEQAELDKLRRELGDDAYRGLDALANCKHTVAIAYAETAQADDNYDYALAGYWLEVLSVAEEGRIEDAEAMLPELVEKDKKLKSTQQADTLLGEVMDELADIREANGQERSCY
jgi:hypothetical protein